MSEKNYPTSIIMPVDLKNTLKRAAKIQGCSMAFKINEILRLWERAYLSKEREVGRGQVREGFHDAR